MDLEKINYIVVDVDGTMTDSGIYYDDLGNEIKKFSTRDAAGFFAAHACGVKIIVLTGRECKATVRRMEELKIDFIIQNIKNKYEYLDMYMKENNISKSELGYIGDDLNDLKAMTLASFIGCPNDSCQEVLNAANYISDKKGGQGAVRDIIEYMLKQRNEWNEAIEKVYR